MTSTGEWVIAEVNGANLTASSWGTPQIAGWLGSRLIDGDVGTYLCFDRNEVSQAYEDQARAQLARDYGVELTDLYQNAPFVADFKRKFYRVDGETVSLSEAVDFSRSGVANSFYATGAMQAFADGEARVGSYVYDGSNWVNGGLRLESAAKTNLLPYSYTEIDTGKWSANPASSVTSSDVTDDIGLDAWKIIPSTDNTSHEIRDTFAGQANTTYTFDVIAEPDGYDYLQVILTNTGFGAAFIGVFNLATGEVVSVSASAEAAIRPWGGDKFRCTLTVTSDGDGGTYDARLASTPTGSSVFAGDGTSGTIIHHAQVVDGQLATSPIVRQC